MSYTQHSTYSYDAFYERDDANEVSKDTVTQVTWSTVRKTKKEKKK